MSEAQALFNPAFGAYLLASAVNTATKKAKRPLPWPSAFLILPLVLPTDTRDSLPGKFTVTLSAWAHENPRLQAGFAERAAALTAYTRTSLRTAMRHQAIDVTPGGLVCPRTPKPPSAAPGEEVADCARAAALVGRWLAVTDPPRAFTALGVRP
ncbi:three component ABC system middle component [Streptomyces virginiae]|uniref:three component ABC system middle component n=1 Tax=Streptomyces virginiae TaxID=1961 RepID=UPI002DB626C3|nr:three component ABC system middle component [Streptomyces sp. CMAA1738]MEC4571068.1 three component ABC system middle component [Streptomyces sp. CMAA1738]